MDPRPSYMYSGEGCESEYSRVEFSIQDSRACREALMEEDFDGICEEENRVKAYLRLKPILPGDDDIKATPFKVDGLSTFVVEGSAANKHNHDDVSTRFLFSKIIPGEGTQEQVYTECIQKITSSFLKGSNALVFCYGATNAGKTYTIRGTPSDPGIIQRSVSDIFREIRGKQDSGVLVKPRLHDDMYFVPSNETKHEREATEKYLKSHAEKRKRCQSFRAFGKSSLALSTTSARTTDTISSTSSLLSSTASESSDGTCTLPDFELSLINSIASDEEGTESPPVTYTLWLCCVEIYNEVTTDLLADYSGKKKPSLKVCRDKNGNSYVKGARFLYVRNEQETLHVMRTAYESIRHASTGMNKSSSRSHCVFQLALIRSERSDHGSRNCMLSSLTFCDLAGKERTKKTGNGGERLVESGSINKSLLVLGRCIKALRSNQRGSKMMVPYRESKLTELMQPYFEAGSQITMLVNLSMGSKTIEESIEVLKFSAIAQKIVSAPTRNQSCLVNCHNLLSQERTIEWDSSAEEEEGEVNDSTEGGEENDHHNQKLNEWKAYAEKLKERIFLLCDHKKRLADSNAELKANMRELQARKVKEIERARQRAEENCEDTELLAEERIQLYITKTSEFYKEKISKFETEHEKQLSFLQEQVDSLQKENESLKEAILNSKKETLEMSELQQKLTTENTRLNLANAHLEMEKEEKIHKQNVDGHLMKKNKELQLVLRDRDTLISINKAQIKDLTEELEEKTQRCNRYLSDYNILSQEADDLREQTRGNASELEARDDRMSRLMLELEDQKKEMKTMKEELIKKEKECHTLKEECSDLKFEVEALKGKVEEETKSVDSIRAKSRNLLANMAAMSPTFKKGSQASPVPKTAFAENKALTGDLEKAHAEIESLKSEIEILKKQGSAMKSARNADIKKMEQTENQHAEEKLKLKDEIDSLRKKLSALEFTGKRRMPFRDIEEEDEENVENVYPVPSPRKQTQTHRRPQSKRRAKNTSVCSDVKPDDGPELPRPRSRKLFSTNQTRIMDESVTEAEQPLSRRLRPR